MQIAEYIQIQKDKLESLKDFFFAGDGQKSTWVVKALGLRNEMLEGSCNVRSRKI